MFEYRTLFCSVIPQTACLLLKPKSWCYLWISFLSCPMFNLLRNPIGTFFSPTYTHNLLLTTYTAWLWDSIFSALLQYYFNYLSAPTLTSFCCYHKNQKQSLKNVKSCKFSAWTPVFILRKFKNLWKVFLWPIILYNCKTQLTTQSTCGNETYINLWNSWEKITLAVCFNKNKGRKNTTEV